MIYKITKLNKSDYSFVNQDGSHSFVRELQPDEKAAIGKRKMMYASFRNGKFSKEVKGRKF